MSRHDKNIVSRLLLIAAAFFLLHLEDPAQAADTLVAADQRGIQKALLQASGADHDVSYTIRWTEFEAAAPLLQALSAGAVDTGIAGDGPFLFAWGAGLPIKATIQLPPRSGGHITAVIVLPGANINDSAGLSGKRIATGRGSIGHLLLLDLIREHKISGPPPQIVFLTPAQAKAALNAAAVDAWSTWEPYVSLAKAQNHARVVADGAGVMSNISFFVANTAAITAKRAQLQDFYRRMSQAYAWGRTHQQEFGALLAKQTGLPLDVAQHVAAEQVTIPGPIDDATVTAEKSTLAAYREIGAATTNRPVSDAFDRSFSP